MTGGTITGGQVDVKACNEAIAALRDAEVIANNRDLNEIYQPIQAIANKACKTRDQLQVGRAVISVAAADEASKFQDQNERLTQTFDPRAVDLIANRLHGFVAAARAAGRRFEGPRQAEIELSRLHHDITAFADFLQGSVNQALNR